MNVSYFFSVIIFEHSHKFDGIAGHAEAILNKHLANLSMGRVGMGIFYKSIT